MNEDNSIEKEEVKKNVQSGDGNNDNPVYLRYYF